MSFTKQEKVIIEAKVYDAVIDVLSREETRGHNAHHEAQHLQQLVIEEMQRWIDRQRNPNEF